MNKPKNWIHGAIKHPGALHRELGVPQGEKIPAGKLAKAAHAGGKLGERARLAETLKTLHKGGGKEDSDRGYYHRGGSTSPMPKISGHKSGHMNVVNPHSHSEKMDCC